MFSVSGNHKSTAGNIGKLPSGMSGGNLAILAGRESCCADATFICTATFVRDLLKVVLA